MDTTGEGPQPVHPPRTEFVPLTSIVLHMLIVISPPAVAVQLVRKLPSGLHLPIRPSSSSSAARLGHTTRMDSSQSLCMEQRNTCGHLLEVGPEDRPCDKSALANSVCSVIRHGGIQNRCQLRARRLATKTCRQDGLRPEPLAIRTGTQSYRGPQNRHTLLVIVHN